MSHIDKAAIRRRVEQRCIQCLCHFTPVDNLDSILTHGLLPRTKHKTVLGGKATALCYPDRERRDELLDATSLSISFPNATLFYAKRREGYFRWWCVLRISPSIVWERDCFFLPANAASQFGKSLGARSLDKPEAFDRMFSEDHGPYAFGEDYEVLVFDDIPVNAIRAIEFDTSSYDHWLAHRGVRPHPDVLCHVRRQYFEPSPVHRNGMLRDHIR